MNSSVFGSDSHPGLTLLATSRQDCSDLHSWGPGVRPVYIIHYILRGQGFIEYHKKTFPVHTGESFLIYPYDTIRYYPDPGNPWEYTWVEFTGKEAASLLDQTAFSPAAPVCPAICPARLRQLFADLQPLDLYHQNRNEANGMLRTLLGLYADYAPAPGLPDSPASSLLANAVFLIRSNFHHEYFHTEQLCQMLGVSRSTLYRAFQSELNISPGEFLSNFRIHQACRLLELGNSVKTAAVSCGFSDAFYFSRAFTDVWASHRQITAGSRKSRTPEANIRGWCSDRRNAQPCAAARSAGRPLQVQRSASPTPFRPMRFRALQRLLPRSVALQLFT